MVCDNEKYIFSTIKAVRDCFKPFHDLFTNPDETPNSLRSHAGNRPNLMLMGGTRGQIEKTTCRERERERDMYCKDKCSKLCSNCKGHGRYIKRKAEERLRADRMRTNFMYMYLKERRF